MRKTWRGVVSILAFIILWQIGTKAKLPWISAIPAPSDVLVVWLQLLRDPGYWQSCWLSTLRVFAGFIAAMIVGIPFGLALAVNRTAYGILFPPFEVLRPIPPLAWVPLSIIFWPTQELSIAFVTFLGAFYTIVLNVIGGAKSIDTRYFQAARSMGSSAFDIFRRIILPGVLPSIAVGAAVGMGITWNVVVAAEMISGGASQATASGGGLGFFIWNSYIGGSYPQIVVGMISIGIVGYVSSELLRRLGGMITPWLRSR